MDKSKIDSLELPSNAKIGYLFTVIFGLLGIYFLSEDFFAESLFLMGMSMTFLLIVLIKADLLYSLNKLWMQFGLLLGMIVSPIVLGIIFFAIFTPIGILTRMFGRDELRIRLIDRDSYWKKRDSDTVQQDAFKHQF